MSKKPYAFIQDFGTYQNQVFVVVGTNKLADIMALSRKIRGMNKVKFATLMDGFPENDNLKDFCWLKNASAVLCLSHFDTSDWDRHEALIHEITHLVQYVFGENNRKMWNEYEAVAYQVEYLFRSIRRKLMNREKHERVYLGAKKRA